MDNKELNKFLAETEKTIAYLQQEIKDIRVEDDKKLKTMQSSLNYHLDQIKGLHEKQLSKTQVKPDIKCLLLKQVEMSPSFQKALTTLESGGNVNVKLGVKMTQKQIPLEIRKDGLGTWTKDFDSEFHDQEIAEKVEEKLKTKDFVKDKDGFHAE
jgi:hypothetical protein